MPRKAKDLTGMIFDKLTVLERAGSQGGHAAWLCKCECGNTCIKTSTNLQRIKTQNCGCISKQKESLPPPKPRAKDISNQRFGKLIALQPTDERKFRSIVWKCQCDCGNICYVPTVSLTSGDVRSCGCLIREAHSNDLTGQRFGKLIALEIAPTKRKSCLEWICQCDCGNKCQVESYALRSGVTRSCGCINSSIGESNIETILKENGLVYKKEYTFKELSRLRFDFALLKDSIPYRLVEFDGEQHFTDKKGLWGKDDDSLEDIQERDHKKNEYALSHNIPLVRIPYWERDNLTIDIIMSDKYLITADRSV